MTGIDPARWATRVFERRLGGAHGVRELGGSTISALRASVFQVTATSGARFAVKLHASADDAARERDVHQRLAASPSVRRLVAWGDAEGDAPAFSITEWLEGPSMLDVVDGHAEADIAHGVARIADFVRACLACRTEGFGPVARGFTASARTWSEHLTAQIDRIGKALDALPASRALLASREVEVLRVARDHLSDFLERERTYFDAVEPALVPVDLSLSNFVVAPDGRVVVADLERFWSADPLLAVGEWTSHTFATSAHAHFLRAWRPLTAHELRVARFYALLRSYEALHDVVSNGLVGDAPPKPPGNPLTFAELLRCHAEHALGERVDSVLPEALLRRDPRGAAPELDWGLKLEGAAERTRSPEETLRALRAVADGAGITRVAEITGLDATGLFVFNAMRPDAAEADHTFTVFSGKGSTREQSNVSAIAEAIERFCAESSSYPAAKLLRASFAEAARADDTVHPRAFNLPADADFDDHETIEWVPSTDLLSGATVWVPACAVFYPYVPSVGRAPFRYFTTGLGAGNSYVESIAHGLREVIERDSAALNRILRNRPAVDPETIDDDELRRTIDGFRAADVDVVLRYITTDDIRIPSFSVICDDENVRDAMFVNGGYGVHPNKKVALLHALQEAALSRAGTISGAREDLAKFRDAKQALDYDAFRKKYAYWFDRKQTIDFRDIETSVSPTVLGDLAHMVSAVKDAGFERVLVVDLSRADLGLRVTKVLVPGIERYSFDMSCIGARARAEYKRLYGRELRVGTPRREETHGR